jgi:phage head maturation protease
VHAAGKVDLDTDRGRQVWRLMKAGTVGFSFGYLIPEGGARDRPGGGKRIVQLDVFEITVTPALMNADTRVLSTKALDDHDAIRTKARDDMLALLAAADTEHKAITKSTAPVQIARFDC